MPAPREQPNPPGRRRPRPEVMPGNWLWLVLLVLLILVFVLMFGFGSPSPIDYSLFIQLAEEGRKDATKENVNIKKAVFIGPDRIEGEFYQPLKTTNEAIKKKDQEREARQALRRQVR